MSEFESAKSRRQRLAIPIGFFLVVFIVTLILTLASRGKSGEDSAIEDHPAFTKIGSYRGLDNNGKQYKKTYFLSNRMKTWWTHGNAVCQSFGMEFLSLETKEESEKFIDLCNANMDNFEDYTFIGGMATNAYSLDGWFWVNSGKFLNYRLNFAPGEPNNHDGKEFCLSVWKRTSLNTFYFNDMHCYDENPHEFLCQRNEK